MKKSKKGGSLLPKKTSPFSSAIVNIELDCATLHVHEALIKNVSTKLLARFQSSRSTACGGFGSYSSGPLTADLKAVSLDVGHILVKWLYTGKYQLREGDKNEDEIASSSSPASTAAENLRIAFGVYALAREYELSELEVLAREQVALLGSVTDVFTFSNVLVEAYPQTIGKDDKWMGEYITTRMKAALKDDHEKNSGLSAVHEKTAVRGKVEEETEAENIPTSRLLVEGMLEAYREVVQQHPPVVVKIVPRHTNDEERKRTVSLVTPHTCERQQREMTVYDDLAIPESAAEACLETETAVVESTAIEPADKHRASPDIDEWVFPSPKKGKERIVEENAVPEPQPPLLEIPSSNEFWANLPRKKDKKMINARRKTILEEPVPEPRPEPEAEAEAELAQAAEPEPEPAIRKSKKKNKKGAKPIDAAPEPVEEIAKEPEPMLVLDDEPRDVWGFWGAKRSPRQSLS